MCFKLNVDGKHDLSVPSKLLQNLIPDSQSEPKDLIWFENHQCSVKKLHVFTSSHNQQHVCRKCLSSFFGEY